MWLTIKRRKANWIGHILRRNCLLKHVTKGKIEGRIEVTGRPGRRRIQLLDDFKEKRVYWKLKEEALDRSLRRTRFGRVNGPVARQTTEWMVCPMIPDIRKRTAFFEGFQSVYKNSIKITMTTEHWWNEPDTGKPEVLGGKRPVLVPLCPSHISRVLARDLNVHYT